MPSNLRLQPETATMAILQTDTANSVLLRYYDAVHHACLHNFNSSAARGNEVLHHCPVQLGTEGHSTKVLLVVQPRWCRCCLERRKALLAEGLARRVYQIDQFTSEEALRRK